MAAVAVVVFMMITVVVQLLPVATNIVLFGSLLMLVMPDASLVRLDLRPAGMIPPVSPQPLLVTPGLLAIPLQLAFIFLDVSPYRILPMVAMTMMRIIAIAVTALIAVTLGKNQRTCR